MKSKYLLPAALFLCALLNIRTVYAQDPITFTDENGEKVSYGVEKEWVRTIDYVFLNDSSKNYRVYQITSGNEVWITSKSGITEYHIGNNGECGWPEIQIPQVDGYVENIRQIPEVDLYWNPESVNDNHITVTYTPIAVVPYGEVIYENTPPPLSKDEYKPSETEAPAETADPTPETILSPAEMPEEKRSKWAIPIMLAGAAGFGATVFCIRRYILNGEENE